MKKTWLLILALCPLSARAETAANKPKILDDVGIVQRLGESIPANLSFRDETGKTVHLADYFQGRKPVLLNMVYYECPMLCTEILNGLVRTLRVIPLDAGKDFNIVTVSFNPSETPKLAAQKKMNYLDKYRRQGAAQGWAFLTGDAPEIKALADAVGFHYQWDPQIKQFAHASALMIATPEGKLSRYFYGVEYPAQDVRLSLVEASDGKIGGFVDQIALYCYHYDPATGRYGLVIMRALQVGGIATLLGLALLIGTLLWREKHAGPKEKHA